MPTPGSILRSGALARIGLVLLLALGGCGPARVPAPALPVTTSGPPSYRITGVVRSIDRLTGSVTIRHDAIAGYMPAMTMPFALAGQSVLEELEVGDMIEGRLEVTETNSQLVDVFITRPAEPTDRVRAPEPVPSHELAVGEVVPDFAMTTQEGAPLRLSDWRGQVVVLTFIYTRCPLPDFCPLLDRKFSELSRALRARGADGSGVRLLSISFDPEHDTPAVLAEHARRLGARPPRWTFAVASHDELRHVAEPLGLSYGARRDEIVHTLSTAVVSPEGRLLALLRGNQWSSEDVLALVLEHSGDGHPPSELGPGGAKSPEN